MKKVLITGMMLPHVDKEIEILNKYALVTFKNTESKEELYSLLNDINIIMTDSTIIDHELLNNCPNLEMIMEYGVGYDNVDVISAAKHGVSVSNVPDGYYKEVAEHAISLMFAVSRQIILWNDLVKHERKWDFNVYPVMKMYGKKLGLIGCGRIGQHVARIANGIGMEILMYDPYLDFEIIKAMNINARMVNLNQLISDSNIISFHLPLTNETRGMVGEKDVEQMKDNVIIINVSRAGIISEKAIINGIENGKIFGVGLDILENETDLDSPLLNHPSVIVTPHVAWKSEIAAMNNEMLAVDEVIRFIKGEELRNVVSKKHFVNG